MKHWEDDVYKEIRDDYLLTGISGDRGPVSDGEKVFYIILAVQVLVTGLFVL